VAVVHMKELLEAGVHFGHRSQRWHPKMRTYIFTERNGIHIIDLQQTMRLLDDAYGFVRNTVAEGGTVLFVGTKRQAQENVESAAAHCAMPYVTQRWMGGMLTNFRTIRQRCNHLLELEKEKELGEWAKLPKKEALWKERELAKLQKRFGGIKNMYYLPSALFVADVSREVIAVKEANAMDIPVVAMVDTNCDPDPIDFIIPSNDDAIRAIKLISGKIADAVVEGQQMRGVVMAEESVSANLPPTAPSEPDMASRRMRPAASAEVAADLVEEDADVADDETEEYNDSLPGDGESLN